MTDDDPFADLGETLADEPDGKDPGGSAESTGSTTDDASSGTPDSDLDPDPMTERAFSYEAAQQRPFYARERTISAFDSWLTYELERELDERGYRNVVVRELTDALLRTVVEEDLVDAVAERFEGARRPTRSESNE